MLEHQIGRIAAIIIGGIAGWLAEQFRPNGSGCACTGYDQHPGAVESPPPFAYAVELITEAVNRIMPSILLLLFTGCRLTDLGCPRGIV